MRKRVCDMDCFHCKYDDCIYDESEPEYAATEKEREHLEHQKQYQKERYRKLRSLGLCTVCGKPAKSGQAKCEECCQRINQRARQKYRDKHLISRDFFRETGCFFCGAECVEGKKVCEKHLAICRKNAANIWNSYNRKKALAKQKSAWEVQDVYRVKQSN